VIVLRVQPGFEAAAALSEIKIMSRRFPGEEHLAILVGQRRLDLGPLWTYDASPQCLAALGEFGTIEAPAC
jgi:hypothetical protein